MKILHHAFVHFWANIIYHALMRHLGMRFPSADHTTTSARLWVLIDDNIVQLEVLPCLASGNNLVIDWTSFEIKLFFRKKTKRPFGRQETIDRNHDINYFQEINSLKQKPTTPTLHSLRLVLPLTVSSLFSVYSINDIKFYFCHRWTDGSSMGFIIIIRSHRSTFYHIL